MSKDFGPVSGYLDPANKSWEQATWRTGRPPLDKEFNLAGELFLQRLLRELEMPSGFMMNRDYYSPDVFPKVAATNDYWVEPGAFRNVLPAGAPVADTFYFGPGQVAHVVGMPVYLRPKTDEWVPITLNAAPVGVAVKRFDLVFLEVWRAAVTGDVATDITNLVRDAAGKIFYNGWVDSPTADNFTDDVLDAGAGVETSRRVQVQWRIRVVDDIDLNTFPEGIDDTTNVFAQGPNATVTASTFSSLSSSGDQGVYASSGHSETVDGYIFAIPICAVARRNQTAWAKDTNQNGGTGTRVDDLTHDGIVERDIIDLRHGVSRDWDFGELCQKNFSWLLDGKLKTYWEDTGLGGGERGTYHTQSDEIGLVDTPGATKIDEFDGWKKQFSDATVAHHGFVTKGLVDRTLAVSPTEWGDGDQFDIALPVTSEGIIDRVLSLGMTTGQELTANMFTVSGINTQTATITLRSPFESTIPLNNRIAGSIFAKAAVTWPGGRGLSHDPTEYQTAMVAGASLGTLESGDGYVHETAVPAGMTALSSSSNFYKPSRTATILANFTYTSVAIRSRSTTTTVLPNDIESVVGIFDAVADPGKTTDLTLGFTDNVITHNAVPITNRSMLVDYISKEPNAVGEQVTLYYTAAAQQSLDVTAGGLNVPDAKIHIIYAPDSLYSITAGSGSHQPGFPYISPGSQIPISASSFTGEHDFDLNQTMNIDDFGTDAQLMRLQVHVPLASIPYFDFTNADSDTEGRKFFNDVQNTVYDDELLGTPVAYEPAVFAKLLQTAHAHKVAYPCLGMTVEDTKLGKRGTLLLLVFTRTSDDSQNAVLFDAAAGGDSCVAIYRLKGNPLVSPRKRLLGHPLIEV